MFVLFTNGHIRTYDTLNNHLSSYELPVDGTIDCALFSNDQELLVVTTSNNEMLQFNKFWTLETSYDMNSEEYGHAEMINVNWGSKSTQFHGEGMRDKRVVKQVRFISKPVI